MQGRRQLTPVGALPQLDELCPGEIDQFVVEWHCHTFVRAREVDCALLASIPVCAQQQPLCANLYPLGIPCALIRVRALSLLEFDGFDEFTVALDEVDPGDEAQIRGGQ